MNRIFITADWHFFHTNLCAGTSNWTHCMPPRKFDSLEDMHDTIIDNLNDVVEPDDILWNLGDVIFAQATKLPSLRARIKCRDIRLVLGNHDHKVLKAHRINDNGKRVPNGTLGHCFADIRERHVIKHKGIKIYLLHEPMCTWPGINIGFIQLHGHCHGNLPDRGLRQMDVGVDTNNFKPYLLDDVVERLIKREHSHCPDIRYDES